jgi:hypothetical protein
MQGSVGLRGILSDHVLLWSVFYLGREVWKSAIVTWGVSALSEEILQYKYAKM